MPRYINEDDFCEYIRKNTTPSGAEWFISKIKDMPAADVVEVVRCKDCIYGIENGELCGHKIYLCSAMTNPNEFYGDFYCANGKRRETNG